MAGPGSDDPPKTRTWRRGDNPPRTPEAPSQRIRVDVPPGDAPDPDDLANRVRASLAGWPVVVLRVVGKTTEKVAPGSWKGRWLRGQVGLAVDATVHPDISRTLLGPHDPGTRISGGAWAPIAVRSSMLADGRLSQGTDVRAEIVLHGRAAEEAGYMVRALLEPNHSRFAEPGTIEWTTVQHLTCDDDGDLRWRKSTPGQRAPFLPMDRIEEPSVRQSRLLMTFLSPAAIAQRGEVGEPWPELPVIVDRMGRTLSTWLKRSKHRGPLLPDADLLRAAAQARLVANHTRSVQLPPGMVGAEQFGGKPARRGAPPPPPEPVAGLVGSATFAGSFKGLVPLLRAAAWVGMGPGRQNGLGELTVR
ncbi:MAG: CRISPR system precrRNA processing endoribonuclease RAMP protein Cas6 [Deltaproteobacteria bacterium]|nr:CRISPR system precrRNA processing endoribonuclease RAMP protein Cas6 [Deltaproteobacteria bacterium]